MQSPTYPIRINRYLALKGIVTRRAADELIKKRRVIINGRIALLGDQVNKNDVVEVKKIDTRMEFTYIAYHKPVGVITFQREKETTPDIIAEKKLFPVGRLDKESSGLLILTNDGRITDRLLNPLHKHEKEYIAQVDKKLTPHILRILAIGVDIEGYYTKPSRVVFLNDYKFRIILGEGKKHQIRRMLSALGLQVRSLKRVRIMNIELGDLKIGELREIKSEELNQFLKALGLGLNH
ncbi:MAG: pseudouridine synthase [bacterium]|nr:pseudouridine synthase [bacterium]